MRVSRGVCGQQQWCVIVVPGVGIPAAAIIVPKGDLDFLGVQAGFWASQMHSLVPKGFLGADAGGLLEGHEARKR